MTQLSAEKSLDGKKLFTLMGAQSVDVDVYGRRRENCCQSLPVSAEPSVKTCGNVLAGRWPNCWHYGTCPWNACRTLRQD